MAKPKRKRSGPAPGSGGRPINAELDRVAIYLRPKVGERAAWERASRAAGLRLSTWIRKVCNEAAAPIIGVAIRDDRD